MGAVSDYLAGLDEPARGVLGVVLDRARALVPEAEEGVSYGMAALRYRGRPLLSAMQSAKHLAVYPFSPPVVEAVAPDRAGYALSKGTIRFSAERPLPAAVVDRIVELRRAEIDAALDR